MADQLAGAAQPHLGAFGLGAFRDGPGETLDGAGAGIEGNENLGGHEIALRHSCRMNIWGDWIRSENCDNFEHSVRESQNMEPKSPTLDQIAVFLAIVETGSFAAAGRKLGRATSAVSYAIANLESQLGVSLFARAGASKPRLTEAGRAILSDGRGLAMALDGLIAKARGLTQGLEAEVSLVVDVMLPAKLVVKVLDEFRRKFPTVGLRLRVEALGAVTEAVLNRSAMFGLSGPLEVTNDLLIRGPAGAVKLIPVAASRSPIGGDRQSDKH